jgi:NAD(P)-dependent dehydrogenase (short-subunit alcohol dehydrogenase family)
MPVFVPGPLTSRSWALPIPAPDITGSRRLRAAVGGRTVLITGASSGIGEASARKLAEAGARTLLVARGAEALGKLADELGPDAHAHPTDLTDGEAVDALVAEVEGRYGGVDVLVNNAGLSIRRSIAKSFDRPHDFERTMALNYFAPVRLVLGFLPGMRERRAGQVVNVSSVGAQANAPRFAAYVASKSALDTFTRVLAAEVTARGIACTTVHMPLVRTPMIAPTKVYDHVPAMSPEGAADLVCEAVRSRRARVEMPLGVLAELTDAMVPGLVTRAAGLAYRAVRLGS